MEGVLSALIFLFVLVSIWAFTNWRKLKNMEKLQEWAGWSICENNAVRDYLPLCEHLKSAQNRANICDKYKIVEDEEWDAAKETLRRYQKELAQSYFDGRLWSLGDRDDISEKDYFVYMLYAYLCENENYGYGQHIVYRLFNNEVGHRNIVFHKMIYVTYMYCKGHPVLQKNVPAWNEDRLKEILDDLLTSE